MLVFNVYNAEGNWIACVECECEAEALVNAGGGYYTEEII